MSAARARILRRGRRAAAVGGTHRSRRPRQRAPPRQARSDQARRRAQGVRGRDARAAARRPRGARDRARRASRRRVEIDPHAVGGVARPRRDRLQGRRRRRRDRRVHARRSRSTRTTRRALLARAEANRRAGHKKEARADYEAALQGAPTRTIRTARTPPRASRRCCATPASSTTRSTSCATPCACRARTRRSTPSSA